MVEMDSSGPCCSFRICWQFFVCVSLGTYIDTVLSNSVRSLVFWWKGCWIGKLKKIRRKNSFNTRLPAKTSLCLQKQSIGAQRKVEIEKKMTLWSFFYPQANFCPLQHLNSNKWLLIQVVTHGNGHNDKQINKSHIQIKHYFLLAEIFF